MIDFIHVYSFKSIYFVLKTLSTKTTFLETGLFKMGRNKVAPEVAGDVEMSSRPQEHGKMPNSRTSSFRSIQEAINSKLRGIREEGDFTLGLLPKQFKQNDIQDARNFSILGPDSTVG